MAEETRAHERLVRKEIPGMMRSFVGPAGRLVELVVPYPMREREVFDLVVHFYGAPWLPKQAVAGVDDHTVVAVVNLGAGSGA
jgi:hypothetical protein